MRRLVFLAAGAAIVASAVLLTIGSPASPVKAATNLAAHVHDSYYHAAGEFAVPGPGTNHALAQATCQVPNPPAACDADILVGDSITWVSPSPFATLPHTVTECTDNSFLICGPAVDANNPIGDSGPRQPPMPGPSEWPYGPIVFNAPGTYYYRCEIHPDTMRGRVVVTQGLAVGGAVDILSGGFDDSTSAVWLLGAAGAIVLLAGSGGVLAVRRVRRNRD